MGALLVSLAAIILASTQYSEVSAGQCANVHAGGGLHAQSVCASGVSAAATSCFEVLRHSLDKLSRSQFCNYS